MDNKVHKNNFRFSLYQKDVLLCENVMGADSFSPLTRQAVDVRRVLPEMIRNFQRLLSRFSYDTSIDVGNGVDYDSYAYTKALINQYPRNKRGVMRYVPEVSTRHIHADQERGIKEKTLKGVECKIALFINDHMIVERDFYVDGFNPVVKYSVDLVNGFLDNSERIFDVIKKADVSNIWDDYDLINKKGLSIIQVRDLNIGERRYHLRSIQ